MTVHKIRSKVLRAEGHKVESVNERYVRDRLAEVIQRDPQAKIIHVEVPGA